MWMDTVQKKTNSVCGNFLNKIKKTFWKKIVYEIWDYVKAEQFIIFGT